MRAGSRTLVRRAGWGSFRSLASLSFAGAFWFRKVPSLPVVFRPVSACWCVLVPQGSFSSRCGLGWLVALVRCSSLSLMVLSSRSILMVLRVDPGAFWFHPVPSLPAGSSCCGSGGPLPAVGAFWFPGWFLLCPLRSGRGVVPGWVVALLRPLFPLVH